MSTSRQMVTTKNVAMQTRNLVTSDGTTLLHRTFSDPENDDTGRNKAAYCTHSQAQHSLNLRATLEGIASRGWKVHATDLRGHGYSTSPRTPLAHMEINGGWEKLVSDLRLGLETAFNDVSWKDRLVVAPNIGAPLVLEVLKTWPDLARSIVFITPPPNQPAIWKLARSFVRARTLIHPADQPDELTMHQLYTFLGARLSDGKRLIDVISSDRAITDALLTDEYAWPTPTTGYFHEMFRGIDHAWKWPKDTKVKAGTSLLILHGGDDPMTANGKFIAPMRRHLHGIGIDQIDDCQVDEGRSGLFIEEARFNISGLIQTWFEGRLNNTPQVKAEGHAAASSNDLSDVSVAVLAKFGFDANDRELSADELVELCYHAIDDDDRWVEMLYRVTYAISSDDVFDDRQLQNIVTALMPHWDRSYHLTSQIMKSAAIGAVLQNVIDRFEIGVAVVSPDMDVSYANAVFMENFSRLNGEPFRQEDGFSMLSSAIRKQATDDFLLRCASGNGEALFMIDGEAVGFHFRPQALRQSALNRSGASGVLILRNPAEKDGLPDDEKVELLQFAYGLTSKEADAALGVADGLSPDAIAKSRGVSVNTTRTHLKRVYEKVGVQGQTELAARLLKGPIGLISGN